MNLEELLASRIARMGKPTLELFVMSYCPFGVQAEEKIIPIVKEFGEQIDFKLQFIAQEKAEPSVHDITPFTSLHGYPEVAENIRQLLIAQEYPDRYLDYILCRGKKLEKSWETCAEKLGINVARIQALCDAPETEQLFRENIQRAAALGIKASPTIFVDGHPVSSESITTGEWNAVPITRHWKLKSVFEHFRRDGSTPICDTIRAENGFPVTWKLIPLERSTGRKEKTYR